MIISDDLFLCSSEIETETCDSETFSARCPYSQQLIITKAVYGHIAVGKCLPADSGQLGCYVDVTEIVRSRCNGKQRCQVETYDPEIRSTRDQKPCLKILAVYMSITHACIPGNSLNSHFSNLSLQMIQTSFLFLLIWLCKALLLFTIHHVQLLCVVLTWNCVYDIHQP